VQISHLVRIGDHVRVRRQRWRVADVRPFEDCRLLALAGTGPKNAGIDRFVLTPFDDVQPVEGAGRPRVVGMRRWRRACRAAIAADAGADALRTAERARIDLLPHQLEPALAIVRGTGSRVLIADEVGLGKTIQAGLIVSELRARGAADRILVLTPAGLREQWTSELKAHFDIEAAVVGLADLKRRVTGLPVGMNPWLSVPIAIASMDYVKRAEVLPAVLACRWDVIVVDEAHVAVAGDRHDAVRALCARAPCVVLLTATPHNGDASAFGALCELG
jgi:superfamily II DNA or RNA helicase